MKKILLLTAATTLLASTAAHAQERPQFYTVFLSKSANFSYHMAKAKAGLNLDNLLEHGRTIRVCQDGPFGTAALACRYFVALPPASKTVTFYTNRTDVGTFGWKLQHPDPALYLNRGVTVRVCPVTAVQAPTLKPTCRIWQP